MDSESAPEDVIEPRETDVIESLAPEMPDDERSVDRILGTTEVARLIGCTPETVRTYAVQGTIPASRAPGAHTRWRFRESDVRAFVEAAVAVVAAAPVERAPVSVIEFGGVNLLTINAVAAALGTSRRTVYRLIDRGHLASFPHAGKTYITADEIKNYFARLQQTADVARAKRAKAHRGKVAA